MITPMKSKVNYQNVLLEIVANFKEKPRLLLHSCCGPCSTEVINFLKDYFLITVYYYNPNIEPIEEYNKRKQEQIRFIEEFNKTSKDKVEFLDCDYANEDFKEVAKNLETEKEGGARCHKCYYLRLKKTALKAKENNFEYFGTTLTVSPYKSSEVINKLGEKIEAEVNVKYIYGDFKKNNGYQKSIMYSKQYNLYRQNYCGCLYGKGEV